ncbi:unnamed protein product [Schistosoma rodhaini]|uniref:Peptidase M12B domain-containing protein n=1 Tax=Schistosoma rodhaini TaxID=6188 RepID=A0AA85G1N7_9TREM|nr:unnamed protein product [Schistosoma rodhaini]CAH8594271.1 unnamed protein product [Schistosoma rodhaini]
MHIFHICLFLGNIALLINVGSRNIISCELFSSNLTTSLEKCSQPLYIHGFDRFTGNKFGQFYENLFCVTGYSLQVDNLKFISEASKNDVYGLFFLSKNKLKGYVNISSSEIYPSGCTILIESINQELRQNENNPNYSTTICHLSGATYNSTIFLLNVTILENDTETFSNVQGWNQILPSGKISKFHSSNNSINSTSSTNVQIFNSYYRSNNIARRVKRSSISMTNTSILDTVHVFHRPDESQTYVVELFMVVDETMAAEFRGRYHQLVSRINMIIALVNELFAPFNIVIVIVRLEIWEQDRVSLKVEEHHLLTALAQFKRMHANVRHDCLHALLGTKEQGSRTRGKANHMTMCIYSRCVGYSRVSPTFDIIETARTIAHELGHNFGLRHDTEECECQGCIMATGVEFGTTVMKWSPCSKRDLPGLLKHGMGVCLNDLPASGSVTVNSFVPNSKTSTHKKNNNDNNNSIPSVVHIYDWQSEAKRIPVSRVLTIRQHHSVSSVEKYSNGLCGNGVLDPGEECDCGTQTSCPKKWQACCDPVRCRLRGNSQCAGGPCCDIIKKDSLENLNQSASFYCKLKSSGTICRNESGTCDLPEYCDGRSQWCPADVYKIDGQLCYTDEGRRAHCIRGGCREADGWCRVLWGKTARLADKHCFYENEVKSRKSNVDSVANCGVHRPLSKNRWEDVKTWTGIACETWHDTSCGRLWCHHQNEKAMLLGWIQSQTRVIHSSGRSCSALVYDPVWPASDPATWDVNNLVQINANGAGVGLYSANTQDAGMVPDGTPCSRGFCYNGSCKSVDIVRPLYSCYCNGHGICNNLGHCHCSPGYKPPYCEEDGNGGSVDSGPPPISRIRDNTLLVVICILFFVILPLIGFGVYYLFIRSGRCLLSTSKEFIYTSSGLRKPFDKNCTECFCQLFRHDKVKNSKQSDRLEKPYPLLAFAAADSKVSQNKEFINGQTNGYCNITSNGKLSNGSYRPVKPKTVSFEPVPSKRTTSNFSGVKTTCSQNTLFTSSSTENSTKSENKCQRTGSKREIPTLISRNDKKGIIKEDSKVTIPTSHLKYDEFGSQCLSTAFEHHQQHLQSNNTSIKPTTFISEPRLETMTYEGPMCSLNDPVMINTLQRKSKNTLDNQSKSAILNNSQSSINKQSCQQKTITNQHNTTQPLTTTIVTGGRKPLSSKDISEPLLQATTYNESLSDLKTARLRLSQKEFDL